MAASSNEMQMKETANQAVSAPRKISPLASVQLSVCLMSLMAATVLLGAWCPQEAQVGQEKVFEAFDRQTAEFLIRSGISDIFHSPWFLTLTALMTLNMIVVSFQRVFPKLKTYKRDMPFFGAKEIEKLAIHRKAELKQGNDAAALGRISSSLTRLGYKVKFGQGEYEKALKAESGRYGRLAATITHIGLLSMLAGITITNWTGFNGFTPVLVGESLSFKDAKHASLWVGKLPSWQAEVEESRRENYPSGEAKQWYSKLKVVDASGKVLKTGEISVNNPLSFDGVDIYQSSWGLDQIEVSFNGQKRRLSLNAMGQKFAAFLPLDQDTVLIMSTGSEGNELRVFAKRKEWEAPKMLGTVGLGKALKLGGVDMVFEKALAVTGLQYKCDPGLPITYAAFMIIMVGVFLAAVPHRHLWCIIKSEEGKSILYIGGTSRKAKVGFERSLDKIVDVDLQEMR